MNIETKAGIRQLILNSGLTPESCRNFLQDDLIMNKEHYELSKQHMTEIDRLNAQVVILQREILLSVMLNAC